MSAPEIMLTSGSASEEILHQRLRHLSEVIQRQLRETERRHKEQLESRILHNTLLSADLNRLSPQTNYEGRKRAASPLAPKPDNNPSSHSRLSESSVPASVSSSERKHQSTLPPTRTRHCERAASCKTTQQMKEEEAEAECKKKFSALPVPIQVRLPLYQEMMEQRDKERKQGLEQRKTFLLSVQKPFSFHQRGNKRQDKRVGLLNQVSQDAKKTTGNNGQQSSPKQVKVPTDQERCRKIHISCTQQENHEKPKLRLADCTRMEKMAFLYEKPSFQPTINRRVPDFSRLHKALQTDGRRTSLTQGMTKCQPFYLRTSALPAGQSKPTPEKSQISSQSNLTRSKSCGALKSLCADTLPIYVTDATRKRCVAIRTSTEMRDAKNKESADRSRKYQSRSEAMNKTVSLRAKLLDPHKSLREVYDERLQHHRETDRQRTRDYLRDLQDMKARVGERPLLFEQVKQRNAKARAEQAYKNELKKAGVKEQFVEEKGHAVKI